MHFMHICLDSLVLIFCSTDHWNIWHWCYHHYASMLIEVIFCFSIWLEDTSSVEVNNNVKTSFFTKKTKEMKTIMIDLINNENEIKSTMIVKKLKQNKYENNWFKTSDEVLEERSWPRESSRTQICVLDLGLEGPGLGFECPGLGLRIFALTTAFFDTYFLVHFFIFETFAVGQTTNLIHGPRCTYIFLMLM